MTWINMEAQKEFETLVANLVFDNDIRVMNSSTGRRNKIKLSQKVQSSLVVPNGMQVDQFVATLELVPVKLLHYVIIPMEIVALDSRQVGVKAMIVNLDEVKQISFQ